MLDFFQRFWTKEAVIVNLPCRIGITSGYCMNDRVFLRGELVEIRNRDFVIRLTSVYCSGLALFDPQNGLKLAIDGVGDEIVMSPQSYERLEPQQYEVVLRLGDPGRREFRRLMDDLRRLERSTANERL